MNLCVLQPKLTDKRKSDAEQESLRPFKKPLVAPFIQNAAVLPECCLGPQIFSSEREKPVSVAPECADDPGLLIRLNTPHTKHAEQEQSLGDFNEPLETRFIQNAAVLPDCCIGPRISSPGRETLLSSSSDSDLLIHGRSVAEYQQLYHSVVDVLVKRKENLNRSKKIKKRLWEALSGPHFCSTALSDTQQQLTESCTGSVYTAICNVLLIIVGLYKQCHEASGH